MRAAPATIGGMPRSSKRASERQSATRSRSPWTTWIDIAVWPSWKVVKLCARAVGIGLLRWMIRSTRPPIVSMPSESGTTSRSSRSPAPALPASASAWRAAPRATTWSGSRLVSGSRPKNSWTARRTSGMRVEPPTRTMPSIAALSTLASRTAWRTAAIVRSTNGLAIASSSPRATCCSTLRAGDAAAKIARSSLESASLARARRSRRRDDRRRSRRRRRREPAPSRRARRRCRRRRAPSRRRWR